MASDMLLRITSLYLEGSLCGLLVTPVGDFVADRDGRARYSSQ